MSDERGDDPDRDAILARRRKLIAVALAGLTSAAGCGDDAGPQACLEMAPSGDQTTLTPIEPPKGEPGDPTATEQDEGAEEDGPEGGETATGTEMDEPARPRVCLRSSAPRPCLSRRPPQPPQPCLDYAVPPPDEMVTPPPQPPPQVCLTPALKPDDEPDADLG